MNIKKSHFFVFGKPKNEMCPKVGNDILSQANNTKLLDFYLNVSMTLYEHLLKLVARLQSNIHIF